MYKINFDVIEFSNNIITLCIAKNCGPRIVFAGFAKDGHNLFGEAKNTRRTALGIWKNYGGHRLWIGPESIPGTYAPDNSPVSIDYKKQTIRASQNIKQLKVIKQICLTFISSNSVKVDHIVYNTGKKDVRCSLWPISVMNKGGFAIIPQNTKKEDSYGMRPTKTYTFWHYSHFNKNSLAYTKNHVFIKQGSDKPTKIGMRVTSGWAGYYNNGYLFIKHFNYEPNKIYPDICSNVEVFTCRDFLELETLSPLVTIKPKKSHTYTETWEFHKNKKIRFGYPITPLSI